jgi:hypothetical protein
MNEAPGAPAAIRRAARAVLLLLGGVGALFVAYGVHVALSLRQWGAILVASGAAMIGFALFLRAGSPERQVNGALVVMSAALCLGLANVYLTLTAPDVAFRQGDRIRVARQQGAPFDERSKFQVVADLRAEGRRAYPNFNAADFLGDERAMRALGEVVPLGSITHALTVLCNETGTYTLFDSDRYGFNNDDAAYDAPGGVEILVVGDSYAQGACTLPRDSVAAQLRANGRNAISVGSAGNGPLLDLASAMEYGLVLKPRIILWLYYSGNDLLDLDKERRSPVLRGYLDGRSQNLASRSAEMDRRLISFIDAKYVERQQHAEEAPPSYEEKIWTFLTAARLRHLLLLNREAWDPKTSTEARLALLERALRQAQSAAAAWGGGVVFVYLPEWSHYAVAPVPTRRPVLDLVRRLGMPVIDFAGVLDGSADPLGYFPFRINNHYTPEGYRELAGQILREMDGAGHQAETHPAMMHAARQH